MGQAVPVRTDYSASEVRRLAKQAKDAGQARRLLAIAAVLDGASREDAAKIGGMDRQTLRDWVIRFNEQGPDGLINIPSPGAPPKLDDTHRAFLARIVEEGPIPAVHGVVRWRACDLIMRLVWGFLCQGCITAFLSSFVISILLFDPRREHSSVPTAYFHRRRAQRRSRTALLQRRRRLVLDGREQGGRLPAIGWLAAR